MCGRYLVITEDEIIEMKSILEELNQRFSDTGGFAMETEDAASGFAAKPDFYGSLLSVPRPCGRKDGDMTAGGGNRHRGFGPDKMDSAQEPDDFADGAEILLDDSMDSPSRSPASPDPSSPFFEKTSENVNRALLDYFEGHPWFHPPAKEPPMAEQPERAKDFADSRRISEFDIGSFPSDAKQAFYRQAVLYADKEGLAHDEVPFSAYFPTYSRMSPAQLDWYFYWRSSIRKGIFIQTSVSYIFLYLYELIHRIGFSSAEEALDQILFVWKEARNSTLALDSYLVSWVRDFILYYGLALEYYPVIEEILGEKTGKYLYQECMLYVLDGERRAGFLNALESCSDYPVTSGRFYKDGYDALLEDAVCSLFTLWNSHYLSKQNRNLMAALGGDSPVPAVLRPFESALFYAPGLIHHESGPVRNSKVTYSFFSRTIGSTLIPGLNEAKKFRKFTTGLLRTVESILRDCTDYRWSIRKGRLPKTQLALIEKQCQAFYQERLAEQKQKEKRVFLVNSEVLKQLKTDSEEIRAQLIRQQKPDPYLIHQQEPDWEDTEEELEEDPDADPDADPDEAVEQYLGEEQEADLEEDLEEDSQREPENPFSLLFSRFTSEQRQVMNLLFRFSASPSALSDMELLQALRQIASASNTFLNVIMEEINDLAVDVTGDCIIDSNGTVPSLYPDYFNVIKETLSDGGK